MIQKFCQQLKKKKNQEVIYIMVQYTVRVSFLPFMCTLSYIFGYFWRKKKDSNPAFNCFQMWNARDNLSLWISVERGSLQKLKGSGVRAPGFQTSRVCKS